MFFNIYLFIMYLFVYYLFIYLIFISLLFTYLFASEVQSLLLSSEARPLTGHEGPEIE
jgi:hypothetical protein